MDLIATLRPLALVLLAIWLLMWAFMQFVTVNNPTYKSIMGVLAGVAGALILFTR